MNDQNKRLSIVMEIMNNLKNFKSKNGQIVDLYSMCSFVNDFKQICNEYIKTGIQAEGQLEFLEINKKIEYFLPGEECSKKPLFVIRK